MKLYNKKLNSLEQLHHEKVLLRYRRRQTKIEDLNPLAANGKAKVTPAAQDGLMGFAMELMGSNSQLQTAITLGKPLLKLIGRSRKKKNVQYRAYEADAPRSSGIKNVIKGIVVTFVIGKAVQMSIRYLGMYRRRKALEKKMSHW